MSDHSIVQKDTEAVAQTEEQGGCETKICEEHDRPGLPARDVNKRMVPVSEAIRYRKRAQEAEKHVSELNEEIIQLRTDLEQSQDTITSLDRRQQIDAFLTEAEAIDIQVARLLTEAAVQDMDEPDVRTAIEDLRCRKPYLFRSSVRTGRKASCNSPDGRGAAAHQAEEAACQALVSGSKRDLLKYLRMKRTK